jgi:hypothetical protein
MVFSLINEFEFEEEKKQSRNLTLQVVEKISGFIETKQDFYINVISAAQKAASRISQKYSVSDASFQEFLDKKNKSLQRNIGDALGYFLARIIQNSFDFSELQSTDFDKLSVIELRESVNRLDIVYSDGLFISEQKRPFAQKLFNKYFDDLSRMERVIEAESNAVSYQVSKTLEKISKHLVADAVKELDVSEPNMDRLDSLELSNLIRNFESQKEDCTNRIKGSEVGISSFLKKYPSVTMLSFDNYVNELAVDSLQKLDKLLDLARQKFRILSISKKKILRKRDLISETLRKTRIRAITSDVISFKGLIKHTFETSSMSKVLAIIESHQFVTIYECEEAEKYINSVQYKMSSFIEKSCKEYDARSGFSESFGCLGCVGMIFGLQLIWVLVVSFGVALGSIIIGCIIALIWLLINYFGNTSDFRRIIKDLDEQWAQMNF